MALNSLQKTPEGLKIYDKDLIKKLQIAKSVRNREKATPFEESRNKKGEIVIGMNFAKRSLVKLLNVRNACYTETQRLKSRRKDKIASPCDWKILSVLDEKVEAWRGSKDERKRTLRHHRYGEQNVVNRNERRRSFMMEQREEECFQRCRSGDFPFQLQGVVIVDPFVSNSVHANLGVENAGGGTNQPDLCHVINCLQHLLGENNETSAMSTPPCDENSAKKIADKRKVGVQRRQKNSPESALNGFASSQSAFKCAENYHNTPLQRLQATRRRADPSQSQLEKRSNARPVHVEQQENKPKSSPLKELRVILCKCELEFCNSMKSKDSHQKRSGLRRSSQVHATKISRDKSLSSERRRSARSRASKSYTTKNSNASLSNGGPTVLCTGTEPTAFNDENHQQMRTVPSDRNRYDNAKIAKRDNGNSDTGAKATGLPARPSTERDFDVNQSAFFDKPYDNNSKSKDSKMVKMDCAAQGDTENSSFTKTKREDAANGEIPITEVPQSGSLKNHKVVDRSLQNADSDASYSPESSSKIIPKPSRAMNKCGCRYLKDCSRREPEPIRRSSRKRTLRFSSYEDLSSESDDGSDPDDNSSDDGRGFRHIRKSSRKRTSKISSYKELSSDSDTESDPDNNICHDAPDIGARKKPKRQQSRYLSSCHDRYSKNSNFVPKNDFFREVPSDENFYYVPKNNPCFGESSILENDSNVASRDEDLESENFITIGGKNRPAALIPSRVGGCARLRTYVKVLERGYYC